MTQAAKFCQMLIPNAVFLQGLLNGIPVELGIVTRHGYGSNIDHFPDTMHFQQLDEFNDSPRGMTDSKDGAAHLTNSSRIVFSNSTSATRPSRSRRTRAT